LIKSFSKQVKLILMLPFLIRMIVSWALLGFSVSAYAVTKVFQAIKDNTMFEDNHNNASGSSSVVFTGLIVRGSSPRRTLWQFDLSTIPPGSQVLSASLRFVINQAAIASSTTDILRLHKLSASWGEGTSDGGIGGKGTQATPDDATWAYRFYGNAITGAGRIPWLNSGGDFNSNASATLNAGVAGTYTFASTPELRSDIAAWINNPLTNFGFILIGPEGLGDSQKVKRIDSRESPSAADRPTLTVEFVPPVTTTPVPMLSNIGILMLGSLLTVISFWISRRNSIQGK
jgi:hypothetical protein